MRTVDVVGLGQCSLDLLGTIADWPFPDSKIEINQFLMQGGGPVATALVTLARLGVATAIIGRLGDDDHGVRIRAGLQQERVDCRALLIEAGATSQFSFIAVEPATGRRTIFCHRGSASALTDTEIDPFLATECRVLHLDGTHPEAALAAARHARARGIVTVLDGGTFRDTTPELLPWIDHLVVSEKFARQMVPENFPFATLDHLITFGASAVTVTLGSAGSRTLSATGEAFHQEAFPVAVVDTTGCGDVFHGGYIFGLLQGWELRRSVRFAAACAALKTRALGGRSAIPQWQEVEEFLSLNEKTDQQ